MWSASLRRKRKKVLIDSLSNQVTDLTKQNQTLMNQNIALKAKVEQLEQSLEQSKFKIGYSSNNLMSPFQVKKLPEIEIFF